MSVVDIKRDPRPVSASLNRDDGDCFASWSRKQIWAFRIVVGSALLAVIALVYIYVRVPVFNALESFFGVVDQLGWRANVIVMGLYVFACIVPIPWPYYTILSVAAGFAFGFAEGLATVVVGVNTLGNLECLIIRVFFPSLFVRMQKNKHFRAMDKALGKNAIKVMALARLGPQPYWLNNLMFSASAECPMWKYTVGHLCGETINDTVYVFSGTLIKSLGKVFSGEEPPNTFQLIALGVGVALVVCMVPVLGWYVRRELKVLKVEEEQEFDDPSNLPTIEEWYASDDISSGSRTPIEYDSS